MPHHQRRLQQVEGVARPGAAPVEAVPNGRRYTPLIRRVTTVPQHLRLSYIRRRQRRPKANRLRSGRQRSASSNSIPSFRQVAALLLPLLQLLQQCRRAQSTMIPNSMMTHANYRRLSSRVKAEMNSNVRKKNKHILTRLN